MDDNKKVYTVSEIRKILGLSKGSTYTFVKNNPPFKVYAILGSYRINKESFDNCVNDTFN